jgi:hypothetical protein
MGTRLLLGVALLLLLAGCRQNTEPGPFVVLQGEKDGHPLFAVIDKTERDDQFKATFPWYLEISTQFMDSTPDGFPKDQEAAVLSGWEDSAGKRNRWGMPFRLYRPPYLEQGENSSLLRRQT